MKYVSSFDMFGYPIELNLNKENCYRSNLGGMFSILTLAFLVILFYNSVVNMFTLSIFQVYHVL